jgi:hypothetical protein
LLVLEVVPSLYEWSNTSFAFSIKGIWESSYQLEQYYVRRRRWTTRGETQKWKMSWPNILEHGVVPFSHWYHLFPQINHQDETQSWFVSLGQIT